MDRKLIAERLLKLRTERKMSVTHVAEKLGVTRATVYRLENGNIDSLMKYLSGLAEEYGCSEEFIFLGYEPDARYISVGEGQESYMSKLDSYKENEEKMSEEIKRLTGENDTKAGYIESLKENLANEKEKSERLRKEIVALKEGIE